ncbi:MAG: helix-turn-helix domain-containing protein [Tenuifilaceae bacterium]
MTNYLLQVQDEETFFLKVRKIVKEELTNSKGQTQENRSSIPYIKADEVMQLLQVSRPTIDDWVDKGFFKKYKVNSRTFYNRDEIIEFLSKQGK